MESDNPVGTGGVWDMCLCCMGEEWAGGMGQGEWGSVMYVCCECGLFVSMAGPGISILC